MKRKIYETPRTTYYSVEVEGSFAGSADVKNPEGNQGEIEMQVVNEGFTTTFDESNWSSEY